jgi:hypothetical protein
MASATSSLSYLNVDMTVIETLVKERQYQLQVQFLLTPISAA